MKYVGCIVTKQRNANYNKLFKVVNNIDEADTSLPTLVVGWSLAKSVIPNVRINNKKYGNLWWTFSKQERKCDFDADLPEFYKYAISTTLNAVKYVYVDFINYGYRRITKMLNFASSNEKKLCFLTRNSKFLFVYCSKYNTVFGVSLTLCEYLGIDKKKVYSLMHNTKYIGMSDFDDTNIREYVGHNTHYILPLYEYFSE